MKVSSNKTILIRKSVFTALSVLFRRIRVAILWNMKIKALFRKKRKKKSTFKNIFVQKEFRITQEIRRISKNSISNKILNTKQNLVLWKINLLCKVRKKPLFKGNHLVWILIKKNYKKVIKNKKIFIKRDLCVIKIFHSKKIKDKN